MVVPCVVDNIGGGHIIQVVAATIVNTGGFEEWWGVVGCGGVYLQSTGRVGT